MVPMNENKASGRLYLFQIRLFITASGQVPPGLGAALQLRFKETKKGRRTPSSLKPFDDDEKPIRVIHITANLPKSALSPLPRWMQNFKRIGTGAFRYQVKRAHGSFPAAGAKRDVLAGELQHHFLHRSVDRFRQFS